MRIKKIVFVVFAILMIATGLSIQADAARIHEAVKAGDLLGVEQELRNGTNIDLVNENGWTALMLAAYYNRIDIVSKLLEYGARVSCDKEQYTALTWAAQKGYLDIIKALIAYDVRAVNQKDKNGWTALMAAAAYGHSQAVDMLLEFGADIQAKTMNGSTALDLARKHGANEVADLLEGYIDAQKQNYTIKSAATAGNKK